MYPAYKKGGLMRVHSVQGYPELNEKWNCPVTGIVTDKKIRKRKDYTLVIKIIDICDYSEVEWSNIREEYDSFKVNGEYDFFSLRNFKISKF